MSKRFEGKVVVVTGGSDGIGLATAKRFVAEGAKVYITGRNSERLEKALVEIGDGAIGVQGDAANAADLDRLYDRVRSEQGKLDVVFANAGAGEDEPRPLGNIDEDGFNRVFGLNVRGVLFTVQKALPLLEAGGAVVLNGSIVGSKGFPNQSLYNASKAAVRSFARSWTGELGQRGIRVNVVSPGSTETPPVRRYFDEHPGFEDMLMQSVPLGRLGQPDEVASAVLFLASSESSYIAGVELFVDGGSVAI
ncbi:SDR family NAD(P)-dependent oxidoreductase [Luteibacter sp. CQ10]|uniref:SDR family NAD(P)-dependent oxidoreductase n=1 Tax=Luteibacter sp. CQ10 TaxID=2805821 RepID=UPI0034A1D3FD